jgi:flagellin
MTSISSLGVSGGQPVQNSNARLQAAIARLVGLPGLFPSSASIVGLSTAAKLQAQTADIRQISANIAQASSLSQVAQADVSDIQDAVSQLQSLAQQAQADNVSTEQRASLNTQFQQIAQQINQLALSSNFNGRALLDGSLSGSGALSLETVVGGEGSVGTGDLSIGNLTVSKLFAGGQLDISSKENAGQALTQIATALATLSSTSEDIGIFQSALDYASANIDTVVANQLAADSAIRDSDPLAADLQQNASNAIAAQTTQLSPKLLQLIS